MNGQREIPNENQIAFLGSHNFTQIRPDSWEFVRSGIVFDLSAANLDMIETIFAKRQFVVFDINEV